jgi:hypothetical protein
MLQASVIEGLLRLYRVPVQLDGSVGLWLHGLQLSAAAVGNRATLESIPIILAKSNMNSGGVHFTPLLICRNLSQPNNGRCIQPGHSEN